MRKIATVLLALVLGLCFATAVLAFDPPAYVPGAGINGGRVVGSAVFAQEVFQNKDRHIGADLHFTHEVFANDPPSKDSVRLLIEVRHADNPSP